MLERLASEGQIIGSGYQAIVRRLAAATGAELVVKSPHPNPVLAWFGRRAIRREALVYERLSGVAGTPRSRGLAADTHLVLEHVPGRTLRSAAAGLTDRERFFAGLLRTIRAMHAAGIAHGDLKRKENTLVGPGELPYIIDFGLACVLGVDSGWRTRLRFEQTRQMDLNAYIKLKYGNSLKGLTPEDTELYRPLLIERLARRLRGPWKLISMRKIRKRRRERND